MLFLKFHSISSFQPKTFLSLIPKNHLGNKSAKSYDLWSSTQQFLKLIVAAQFLTTWQDSRGVGNQNLGINLKNFQYFHNKSIISFQNHYKRNLCLYLILSFCMILWRKKVKKCHFHKNALFLTIFEGQLLTILRIETKSRTCILLSNML